jgi:Protein of unknown function (DUF2934)
MPSRAWLSLVRTTLTRCKRGRAGYDGVMSETRARSPRKTTAKIATSETALAPAAEKAEKAGASARTRKTAIPRDAIEQRAYELSQDGDSGTPEENWLRAEQELRNSAGA